MRPGRKRNARARVFGDALVGVAPFVERRLLGLAAPPPDRCLVGASYSAVLALQVAANWPGHFGHCVLGSPSVCFDPEVLAEVAPARGADFFVAVGADEAGPSAGNVHPRMVDDADRLVAALRSAGAAVDGVAHVACEDHTSVKLSLASRGLAWFVSRVYRRDAAARAAASLEALEASHARERSSSPTPSGERGRREAWSPTLALLSDRGDDAADWAALLPRLRLSS